MKVSVETDALVGGAGNINDSIDTMEKVAAYIKSCLDRAREGFTSVNYFRTADDLRAATHALSSMTARLTAARKFLERLASHIDEYASCVY